MKITRHLAKDMRQALRLVRDQLGPEAVILTSKRTPFGVEVTAAIDFDAARVEAQATQLPASAPASEPRTFRPDEFVPPSGPGPRPEYDPYTIADAHQEALARAEEEVQRNVFARLQAEMQRGGASAAAPRAMARDERVGAMGATSGRGVNSDVMAAALPAHARAVQNAASLVPTPVRAVQSVASAPLHGGQYADSLIPAPVHAAQSAAPMAPVPARAVRSAASLAMDDIDDGVHAALESAIDSYMAADDITSAAAPSSATPTASSNATIAGMSAESESDMGAELKAMRRILETQMAQLAWNDLTRRAPIHTEILRELTEVGLTQEFASQIVAQLPAGSDMIKARRFCLALMSQKINTTGDRWLDKGGRVALVGPTGVGKTTALAKLAVRWVLRHGARNIALISADGIRIGAHDQLQALGQMIDVPVYVAESLAEIPKLLEQLGQKRFVLIDTPGMSQRDAQLAARMSQLAEAGHGIETALVLSASTQAGAIAETVARFAPAKAASALLTKVDEAASLGGILSVLARAEMPISYVSEGQRVPEDLRPARALELVSSAVQLAKTSGAAADEDLLRRRYGEVAHAIA